MKKTIIAFLLFLVFSIAMSAQAKDKLKKVYLQDGTTIIAYVEKTAGGYKLTTEDGAVLEFREGEITFNKTYYKPRSQALSTVKNSTISAIAEQNVFHNVQQPKYSELKYKYSARDYYGYQAGDRYNPALMGVASFFLPGLGQYITGCQVGCGILQTCLFAVSFPCSFTHYDYSYSYRYGNTTYYGSGSRWFYELAIPMLVVWAGTATWSAISAAKAAKIKNLYYRDVNGVAYKFDVSPYIDVTHPVLASNMNVVSGLSLRISF